MKKRKKHKKKTKTNHLTEKNPYSILMLCVVCSVYYKLTSQLKSNVFEP